MFRLQFENATRIFVAQLSWSVLLSTRFTQSPDRSNARLRALQLQHVVASQ
jgi:hypothetical protein